MRGGRPSTMRSRSMYPAVKRFLDVVVALALLGPILAALAVAALASLVVHGRPVLVIQHRIGRHGTPFRLVKLRTMTGPPGCGRAHRGQHRLTGCGRLLRRLGLAELPPILQLLTGSMSLVGPRPLLAEHLDPAGGAGGGTRSGLASRATPSWSWLSTATWTGTVRFAWTRSTS